MCWGGGFVDADLTSEARPLLELIAIVLLALWILGLVSSHTLGGFIHILIVVAVVMVLVRVIRGRGSR